MTGSKAHFFQQILPRDPRLFQIAALSTLLAFGITARAFAIEWIDIVAIVSAAMLAQWLGSVMNAVAFDWRSPLITALSLTLLLRADHPGALALAALIAIGSKFALRARGKHLFNPANFGIVAMLLFSGGVWTTPGQWGTAIWLAAVMAGAGMFVVYRAARLDVPLIFLGTFAALIIARALWLGDPLQIPLLRLQNGALILFAFFMISDPKTTPDGARARAAFSVAAALLAYWMSYHLFIQDGLFYALALICAVRPLLEMVDPAPLYQWRPARISPAPVAPSPAAPSTVAPSAVAPRPPLPKVFHP